MRIFLRVEPLQKEKTRLENKENYRIEASVEATITLERTTTCKHADTLKHSHSIKHSNISEKSVHVGQTQLYLLFHNKTNIYRIKVSPKE